MSVKASVSITESQDSYMRNLVSLGHYPSVSAVVQRGLELLRKETQTDDALRELLAERMKGPFVSLEEGAIQTEDMLKRMRTKYGS